jgi:hypothetical protein
LADEITTGLTDFGVITVGACCANDFDPAATNPAAAVVMTNSRRLIFFIANSPDKCVGSLPHLRNPAARAFHRGTRRARRNSNHDASG